MRDTEIVASIMAGDPKGLAAAYDRYADPLFKYCRFLLGDPTDAADAVQDTFVVAASRLDGLREPERLRAWLYAVARNESLRSLRSKKRTSVLGEAPDVTDDSADVSEHAQRSELRALFEAAAAGLNPGEREVIELQLRQGLEAGEVASVLGVSRNHAHTLLSRARDQLEACLGVLLVGRAGRGECGELGVMLNGWDGRLTVLLRKRVHRHIEHCSTCAARRAFELRPARLLDLSPGAAMAAGAVESLRLALGAPPGLRAHTIVLATGHGQAAAVHSTAVLSRTGGFGKQGFPKPAHAGAALTPHGAAVRVRVLRPSPRGQATVIAAVAVAVALAAAAFALTSRDEHNAPSANPKPPVGPPAAPVAAGSGPALAGPGAGGSATGKPTAGDQATGKPSAKRSPLATTARVTATPTVAAAATAPVPPQPAPPAGAPTPARSTAGPVPSAPASTTDRPPAPSTGSTAPAPSRSNPPPPPPPGTLSVRPDGGTMLVYPGPLGSPVSLHASGGAVHWAVSVANDPSHAVSVSPAGSGTLTPADPAITLTVRVSGFLRCGPSSGAACPSVSIAPGGPTFAVSTGWTLPVSRSGRTSYGPPVRPTPGGVTPAGTPPGTLPRHITFHIQLVTHNYHLARTRRLR